jgi:hypothetical protein
LIIYKTTFDHNRVSQELWHTYYLSAHTTIIFSDIYTKSVLHMFGKELHKSTGFVMVPTNVSSHVLLIPVSVQILCNCLLAPVTGT